MIIKELRTVTEDIKSMKSKTQSFSIKNFCNWQSTSIPPIVNAKYQKFQLKVEWVGFIYIKG